MRRCVTYHDTEGKSGVRPDTSPPKVSDYQAIPGMRTSILWATDIDTRLPAGEHDPALTLKSLHPAPGASVFMTLTLPPDSIISSPTFDPMAAAGEQARLAPGLAERFEPDAPGFHTTDTVDYVIVLNGNIWLETDTGEVKLGPHDCVVQNGTRHAWRNRADVPATIAVVLLGVHRVP
jgi:mannose-6-phosphate isomerase-like protein (cupin superfamily)